MPETGVTIFFNVIARRLESNAGFFPEATQNFLPSRRKNYGQYRGEPPGRACCASTAAS